MDVQIITYERLHGRATGSVGSSIIRGSWLVDAWPELSHWSTGAKSDAMIFQKAYWAPMIRDFPGPKILDLCDPDWQNGDLKLVELAQDLDAITCSNEGITGFVKKVITHIPVITIPDRLNLKFFPKKKEHHAKAGRVVYFGYKHNADKVLTTLVLSKIAQLGLELLVVSERPLSIYSTMGVNIKYIKWDQATAYQNIQFGDIAINPPLLTPNYRYKSNNKTLVAWALGLPVASMANDIERFLDPTERQAEVEQRTKEIEMKWRIEHSVEQFKELLGNMVH